MSSTLSEPIPKSVRNAANRRFESMLPELQSRCRRMANRYPQSMRQDAADDALAFCYANHLSCFARGKRPTASDLAFYAVYRLRYRSFVTRPAYPGGSRRRVFGFSDIPPEDRPNVLGQALSTAARDDPFERARVKLDWAAFADGRDARTQRVLLGLSIGETKAHIAARIGVSKTRLSQLLDDIGGDVNAFFETAHSRPPRKRWRHAKSSPRKPGKESR